MIDEKYLALIHGELDGANSPKQSAKLKAYLAANVEAQKFYDELAVMFATLQEVKPIEPPAHLQYAIMNALPPRRDPARAGRNFLSAAAAWLTARLELKHAFSFASGLAVGVALFALFFHEKAKNEATDWSKLYGTIGAPPAASQLKSADSLEIRQPGVSGVINLKHAGETLVAEIALATPQPLDFFISYDANALGFKSFAVLEETEAVEADLRAGRIKLSHAGEKHYAFIFSRHGNMLPSINFQVMRAGTVLFEDKISWQK
jgi:hypothetical protein